MSREVARRVVGYVDGFNLYHGMHSQFGRKWLWLDIEVLVRRLHPVGEELTLVRYFTAGVRDDIGGAARQSRYLNGLTAYCKTLEIHLGRYQARHRRCRFCGRTWRTYEEKETDVSIAVRLVADANANRFDTALIVSADGGLVPAIQEVRRGQGRGGVSAWTILGPAAQGCRIAPAHQREHATAVPIAGRDPDAERRTPH